jgi:hypothetical protein
MALWGIQVHGFYTSGFGVGFGTWSARDAIAVPAFPPFAYLDWGGLVGSLFACLLTDARHGSSFAEFSKKRILLTRTLSSVFEERRCRLRTMGHGGASSCLIGSYDQKCGPPPSRVTQCLPHDLHCAETVCTVVHVRRRVVTRVVSQSFFLSLWKRTIHPPRLARARAHHFVGPAPQHQQNTYIRG